MSNAPPKAPINNNAQHNAHDRPVLVVCVPIASQQKRKSATRAHQLRFARHKRVSDPLGEPNRAGGNQVWPTNLPANTRDIVHRPHGPTSYPSSGTGSHDSREIHPEIFKHISLHATGGGRILTSFAQVIACRLVLCRMKRKLPSRQARPSSHQMGRPIDMDARKHVGLGADDGNLLADL